MKKYVLDNGVRLIYEYREGSLSSFCIGFEAGANMEEGFPLGTAHAVEHMLFKGTVHRTEFEINCLCDEMFAFNNAMTNYPYSIYYGTTLSGDFEKALDLYTDILLNPIFPEEGFKEEMSIINEELKEWQDDLAQYCEDVLLGNAFTKRRIKDRIIGTEESLKIITLDILAEFYKKFYCPQNCVIAVASSMTFEEVEKIVKKMLEQWQVEYKITVQELYENNRSGTYIEEKAGLSGAKIQYIFPMHELNDREAAALRLFSMGFGEGTSSLLYDELRTKHGLVYDVKSVIKNEKGIKLFAITLATSQGNTDRSIQIINSLLLAAKTNKELYNYKRTERNLNGIKLKREFMAERSVEYTKGLATYEIMYGDVEQHKKDIALMSTISPEEIIEVLSKVLINPSIQILKPI
jgi:predicted Zn-dependent peptidase